MTAKCFKLKCLTNMHVGNGDVNFSIIDNEVERDPVTGFPTINASGVKGALRMFFEAINSEGLENSARINEIFGQPASESKEMTAGKIKFFSANMLAIPMRASDGNEVYHLVTNQTAIHIYENLCKTLGISISLSDYQDITKNSAKAEGKALERSVVFDDETVCIMNKADFLDVSLPVVARNKLENGESKQLWYEEIVPHESIFYFFAVVNDCDKKLLEDFAQSINGQIVQFGGNASVGCGFCRITEIGGQTHGHEEN